MIILLHNCIEHKTCDTAEDLLKRKWFVYHICSPARPTPDRWSAPVNSFIPDEREPRLPLIVFISVSLSLRLRGSDPESLWGPPDRASGRFLKLRPSSRGVFPSWRHALFRAFCLHGHFPWLPPSRASYQQGRSLFPQNRTYRHGLRACLRELPGRR